MAENAAQVTMDRRAPGRSARPSLVGRLLVSGLAAGAALGALPARADICKYADADGNVHYTNVAPERGWKKLGCTVGGDATVRPSAPATGRSTGPSPAGFPRVDTQTQKSRDDTRRKVLAEELASEEGLLKEARAAYADGAPVPLPEEKADAEKYRARIARLRQAVALHQKNIEALKKELAAVK